VKATLAAAADVAAGDLVRVRVRRELHAAELTADQAGQCARQQRLAGAGRAFEQQVAAGQDRDQHELDHLFLPDDRLGDFRLDDGEELGRVLEHGLTADPGLALVPGVELVAVRQFVSQVCHSSLSNTLGR